MRFFSPCNYLALANHRDVSIVIHRPLRLVCEIVPYVEFSSGKISV